MLNLSLAKKLLKKDHNYSIVSDENPYSTITEQYRKLRTNIDYSNFNESIKMINLTSSLPGEGKTITALNLGTVYSHSKLKTLIIDMDLRKPKIHRAFNISNSVGLSQIITKNLKKENAIYNHTDYLHVLPAGEKMPFPAEFLLSKPLKNLMDELRNDYDKIIIDCPPMAAVTDASIISKFTDGTIMVVASRNTAKPIADEVLKTLKNNGATILGGVLTHVKQKDYRYQTGYYYYGE